ncbi:tRNA (uridine(54)-C5)-methyltransferase TrmA [bacterium]|nr:tRNA (uridine(54)-C5)-methyltransferase TrmA [bacterium]
MTIHSEEYQAQLARKLTRLQSLFSDYPRPEIDVYPSPNAHYRARAEFTIWHEDDESYYAMHQPGEKGRVYKVEEFPQASVVITTAMPKVLHSINRLPWLRKKLFQIEFLSTTTGELLVTFIYHKKLDEQWTLNAADLAKTLDCHIIGRARKQKLVISQDYVTETMVVDGKSYAYQQVESSFTQPNSAICQDMLNWAANHCQDQGGDMLELYCGNGNFTLPLSKYFDRVLATEISKTSVRSAKENSLNNNIDNITFVRLSSEEFSEALSKTREFRRLKDIELDHYRFTTVLVDPPRSGVDDHTLTIIKTIPRIIYISCNPETLKHNIDTLSDTHTIEHVALFDQFPYTDHIECGVVLTIK